MTSVNIGSSDDSAEGQNGRVWWAITWRLLLIVVGIPAVWILRATGVVNLSTWQAIGLSVILLLAAAGQQFLAAVIST